MSLQTAPDLLLFLQVGRVFSGLLCSSWGMSLISSLSSLPPFPHSSAAQQLRHITDNMPHSHSTVGPEVCRKLMPLEVLYTEQPEKQQSLSLWDGTGKLVQHTGAFNCINYYYQA